MSEIPFREEVGIEKAGEKLEIIKPPGDCYFIHGVRGWSKYFSIGIEELEISASLQKDRYSEPIRPYGYVLELEKGAIVNAFDRDVTSEGGFKSKKILKEQSASKNWNQYDENSMEELMKNTKPGGHNELWIQGDKCKIIGAYVTKDALRSVAGGGGEILYGACELEGLPIKIIEDKL